MGLECCKEQKKGQPGLCADIDECLNEEHTCHSEAICTNTVGGYTCACREGFLGNGTSCKDDPCTPENPCGEGDCSPSDRGNGYTCQCRVPQHSGDCADLKGKLSLVLNGANRTIDNTNEYWIWKEDADYEDGYHLKRIYPTKGNDSTSSSIEANRYYLGLWTGRTSIESFGIYSPKICEPARWCYEFAYKGGDKDSILRMTSYLVYGEEYVKDRRYLNQSSNFAVANTMEVTVQCGEGVYFDIEGWKINPETTVAIDNVKIYAC